MTSRLYPPQQVIDAPGTGLGGRGGDTGALSSAVASVPRWK